MATIVLKNMTPNANLVNAAKVVRQKVRDAIARGNAAVKRRQDKARVLFERVRCPDCHSHVLVQGAAACSLGSKASDGDNTWTASLYEDGRVDCDCPDRAPMEICKHQMTLVAAVIAAK